MPVWGTYTSAPDTSAPDIHPPYREANSTGPLPRLAVGILVTLCAAKLLLHLFTSVRHYGYFRDELYYLDMARHLDCGYVEPFDHYQRFGMARKTDKCISAAVSSSTSRKSGGTHITGIRKVGIRKIRGRCSVGRFAPKVGSELSSLRKIRSLGYEV